MIKREFLKAGHLPIAQWRSAALTRAKIWREDLAPPRSSLFDGGPAAVISLGAPRGYIGAVRPRAAAGADIMRLSLAFLAGLLSLLSPCVLPLAPVVVAGAQARDPRGPLALAFGLALAYGVAGGLTAVSGVAVGGDFARPIAAAMLLAAGVVLLVPPLRRRVAAAMAMIARAGDGFAARLPVAAERPASLAGFAAAGVALAFVWTPCVGPTLGAAFALAAGGGSLAMAMATMFSFALGAALALLGLGYGLRRLATGRRLLAARAGRVVETGFAILLIALGAGVLTGLDRVFEAAALAAAPRWLIALTTTI